MFVQQNKTTLRYHFKNLKMFPEGIQGQPVPHIYRVKHILCKSTVVQTYYLHTFDINFVKCEEGEMLNLL